MDSQPKNIRLFHISEEPGIKIFDPRPSPSHFDAITGDVVFAISGHLLHNYLLPRDCPRVTYYMRPETTLEDKHKFFGESRAEYIITVPSEWYETIKTTPLYCYEFAPDNFTLLDECAGYYISYSAEKPIAISVITDPVGEILARNTELRFSPAIIPLSKAVAQSSLGFSMVRMRNTKA
ncbi:MAG TPA: hypothetical protein VHS53_14585 [Mucilaginibacter sp.]|jgi:hypothetical protein|nr:hypothetical protein [Mucilaginibacter sp.]